MNKKAVILDVDGVIIGEKKGVNTPHPCGDVMLKLKEVRAGGVPVVLCTAKPAFAIEYEIKEACLDNPHIADGGGLLVDNKGVVAKQYLIDSELAGEIVDALLAKGVYTEVYTADDYYIQESQRGDWTDRHTFVLQRPPQIVSDLAEFCRAARVTKVMQVVADEGHKPFGNEVFEPFAGKSSIYWAVHPPILPLQFGVITAQNITKKQGVYDIAEILDVPIENILAVGDSASDWKFMEICGYAGAMGNASKELKELVSLKGEKGCIGKHVDENGVIGIIDWYLGT